MTDGTRLPDDEPRLPPGLQRDLRSVFARGRTVPDAVDRAVRAAAAHELGRPARVFAWRARIAIAAAAALLIALGVGFALRTGAPPQRTHLAREDYDGSGRVDVLDAYGLALALQRGVAVDPRFDLDGDGRVDGRDVDTMARTAVRLETPR